ncbi:MAG: PfkB family carbohydrate kinase [Terrimicrobiaceae bacterium]
MSVLIVGSIALDNIKTPEDSHENLLGGSAAYGAVAASFFSQVRMVGIVGEDFPKAHIDLLKTRNIDLEGLEIVPGKTFRWSGEYLGDMNTRETLSVELNVFETFRPKLPASYRDTRVVLLANIAPDLQHLVLDQAAEPDFVIADTMDLWIQIARDRLMELLGRVDLLILNDGEARQLTGETNLIRAGKALLAAGPRFVAIKKGEHGCLLMSGDGQFFACPAFPLEGLRDPTGAGDTFAGGLAGVLAALEPGEEITFDTLRRAVVRGSVLASFNVEAFSLERLKTLSPDEIDGRLEAFRQIASFG